jgi:hypothetical protein
MRWLSSFLACQHLSSGTNLRECEDRSWFKVQALPVFRFDWYNMFSCTPGWRPQWAHKWRWDIHSLLGYRTRDLPACSIMPQPTTLRRAPPLHAFAGPFTPGYVWQLWLRGGKTRAFPCSVCRSAPGQRGWGPVGPRSGLEAVESALRHLQRPLSRFPAPVLVTVLFWDYDENRYFNNCNFHSRGLHLVACIFRVTGYRLRIDGRRYP